MKYCLYQITNKVNNKIYVGVHKTKSLEDGYMGSGKVIRSAIMKHGIENFTKVILETFEDEESMYAREKEVVNDEFLSRDDVYNIRRGGSGGFEYINRNNLNGFSSAIVASKAARNSNLGKRKFTKEKLHGDPEKLKSFREKASESGRLGMLGKTHDEDTRKHMSDSHKGSKNSQFGTCWINNGFKSMKVKKDTLDSFILDGWKRGRMSL